jgi:hypothetical protein
MLKQNHPLYLSHNPQLFPLADCMVYQADGKIEKEATVKSFAGTCCKAT